MRLRRSILAAVLAPTVALASVTPAVAETDTQSTSSSSSSSDSDEWWDGLHPVAKVAIGIAAATGISVAFGILRTIFYNIFHV